MVNAIAFGIAAGAGFQAWRHWPSDGPVTTDGVYLLLLVGLVCSYLGGLWQGRGKRGAHASASAFAAARSEAVAKSEATQTVNVAVVMPGMGAGASSAGVSSLDSLPWLGRERLEVVADDVEGMDMSELIESTTNDRMDS